MCLGLFLLGGVCLRASSGEIRSLKMYRPSIGGVSDVATGISFCLPPLDCSENSESSEELDDTLECVEVICSTG